MSSSSPLPSDRSPAAASARFEVLPRFDTVDLLRGLSILAVVIHHTGLRLYFSGYALWKLVPRGLRHLLFWNGQNGVTVFFVISGFLITLTSLRRFGSLGAMRPGVFYRIRFARIAPLLGLVVAVLSGLALARVDGFQFSSKMAPLWRAVVSAFTFHLNWLEARYGWLPANWDVMWSLSIEEMFYLFFPLVCVAMLRLRRGMGLFVALLLVFVGMGPFARGPWTTNEIWQEKTYLGGMDAIALGCLTALLVDWLARRDGGAWAERHQRLLLGVEVVGAVLVGLTAVGPKWYFALVPMKPVSVYETALAAGAAMVMLGSVLRQGGWRWMRVLSAPVRWYGRHSYELYLTHEFVVVAMVFLFLRIHPNPNGDRAAAYMPPLGRMVGWCLGVVALTVPLGWGVARFFSEPLNRRLRE